jgi:voltage-gated sodium channel
MAEGASAIALCKASQQPFAAPFFFITFILFGTMIVLNLFIGIIMNSMQEAAVETARAEQEKAHAKSGMALPTLEQGLLELSRAAEQLAERARNLKGAGQGACPRKSARRLSIWGWLERRVGEDPCQKYRTF